MFYHCLVIITEQREKRSGCCEQNFAYLLVNDGVIYNNCTVWLRSFQVPQPISVIAVKHCSLERSPSPCGALSWGDAQPLKHSKSYQYMARNRVRKGWGARRGVVAAERVLDPVVSARGTYLAGTQAVLSDGRAATAVFRNTSRPVYCLGVRVSAQSAPSHCSK